jgi:hypothetical protein
VLNRLPSRFTSTRPALIEEDMGHRLERLPEGHPHAGAGLQCAKCGCVFSADTSTHIADFIFNCRLERQLREQDPSKAIEILVE